MELSVRDLIVSTRSGDMLVDLPRLDTTPGVSLGIRGASGAGKSTLLRALMGLTAHTTGEIMWGETSLLRLSQKQRASFRRRHMGIVFQDFLLFEELGAADNAAIQAAFSPPAERGRIRDTARTLLDDLGVRIGSRRVARYSGGERQRIAVARALAHDPKIVLADEPTASLDRETGDALTDEILARVRERGLSLIVVSHDERLLERMDRLLALDHGHAVEAYA